MKSPIALGQMWESQENHVLYYDDDRHLITVAGSRSGKGVSLIVPNLLQYPGSVVCIDPKGENASITAKYRASLGQKVLILDPFCTIKDRELDQYKIGINPISYLNSSQESPVDEASSISDAIVVNDNEKDPHWNESARTFIKGLILYVLSNSSLDSSLSSVHSLAYSGLDDQSSEPKNRMSNLFSNMQNTQAFNGTVAAIGHAMQSLYSSELSGVLSCARRHLEFLESPGIKRCMSSEGDSEDGIESFWNTDKEKTIYLVLPEWRIGSHSRWLRLMISVLLRASQDKPTKREKAHTLFILDEFAALGHMENIERAAAYIAGFGVKLWFFLQDIGQIKSIYRDRWETFIGNSGALTFFANSDLSTLQYISDKLGEHEIIKNLVSISSQNTLGRTSAGNSRRFQEAMKGGFSFLFGPDTESKQITESFSQNSSVLKVKLLNPDEICKYFSRDNETILVLVAGLSPFRLNRIRSYMDEPFLLRAQPNPYHL
jgi:type IV secretion system protein VirD4